MNSNDFLAEIVVCYCESLIWFAVYGTAEVWLPNQLILISIGSDTFSIRNGGPNMTKLLIFQTRNPPKSPEATHATWRVPSPSPAAPSGPRQRAAGDCGLERPPGDGPGAAGRGRLRRGEEWQRLRPPETGRMRQDGRGGRRCHGFQGDEPPAGESHRVDNLKEIRHMKSWSCPCWDAQLRRGDFAHVQPWSTLYGSKSKMV